MRVRIITTTTYPDGMAATSRIRCYAKALQEEELQIEVVATNGLSPQPGKRFILKGEHENIPFTLLLNMAKFGNRWLNYAWSSIKTFLLVFHTIFTMHRFDVCIIYVSDAWPKVLLLPFLKIADKKIVLELNEYPYAAEGNKITRYTPVKRYLRWITFTFIFPMLDGVLAISERLEQTANHNTKKAYILSIPILTDKLRKIEKTDKKLKISKPYLFHAGSLSEQKDGIVEVFEAFALAHQKLKEKHGCELTFYLTNNTTQPETWQKIETILEEYGVEEFVKVTGYLSEEELKEYESGALALILNKPSTFQNLYNFPTKLSSYLSSGSPVIVAANDLELNRFLKQGKNAFVVAPDNSTAMAEEVMECYEDPFKAKQIVEEGVKTVEQNFYYMRHSRRLADFIRSI